MTTVVPMRVVVLISGGGTNLQALLDAAAGGLPIEPGAVVSSDPSAYGLERARRQGVPAISLVPREFARRADYDAALADLIDRYQPGLIALAGFMRILGADFVARYRGRMLNIHPSLLPDWRGLHTHRRVLEAGAREHGASVHFVTEELDGGPVVLQARVAVLPDDDEERLARRVLAEEHRIYPRVIEWFATGRLRLAEGGHAELDGRTLYSPLRYDAGDPVSEAAIWSPGGRETRCLVVSS